MQRLIDNHHDCHRGLCFLWKSWCKPRRENSITSSKPLCDNGTICIAWHPWPWLEKKREQDNNKLKRLLGNAKHRQPQLILPHVRCMPCFKSHTRFYCRGSWNSCRHKRKPCDEVCGPWEEVPPWELSVLPRALVLVVAVLLPFTSLRCNSWRIPNYSVWCPFPFGRWTIRTDHLPWWICNWMPTTNQTRRRPPLRLSRCLIIPNKPTYSHCR